jgi:agmatinase
MIKYPSRGSYSFLGLESAKPEEADVIIFPVPYDSTSSYKPGTRFGPRAIILASNEIETFDLEMKKDLIQLKFCTLPELEVDVGSPESMVNSIANVCEQIVKMKKFFVMLGGEHTISIGSIKALTKFFRNFSVVCLDAHADLRESFQNSNYSHACTMRRVLEFCKDVIWIGTRSMSKEEYEFVNKQKLKIYDKIVGLEEIIENCKENVYLSIDLDVFDPSIIPSVGTPVANGLGWEEVLKFIKRLSEEKNIIGADVVEFLPQPFISSEDLVAQLVAKLIAYRFWCERRFG